MSIPGTHTKVLIVGAGPSGLMMAAQLLRHGVEPVIIDKRQGPTHHSKALAVQARSLEIYRQMGIDARIVKDGKHAPGAALMRDGREMLRVSLAGIGAQSTLFPYIHLYQQSKNERLLLDHLTQNCCPVYWNTTFESLQQGLDEVKVNLVSSGEAITLSCNWVIGADGAHSPVRKSLSIPFTGDTYPHLFYLLDAELNGPLTDDYIRAFLKKNNVAGFFPLPEPNCYRIIGNLPTYLDEKAELQLDDVLPFLNDIIGFDISIKKNNWFVTYKLHHRMAEKFRQGRCILVGDAAHIHSPVGGQGMNTGLQDAYNLAWKLAGVINGWLDEGILDSYAAERMPVAKALLKSTDRAFTLLMSANPLARLFKKWLMPAILKFAWSKESFKRAFFSVISQTGIHYRDSKINLQLSQSKKVKAGDRLPYIKVYDEKKLTETDLHEWCKKPGFTFILLGKQTEERLFQLARWLNNKYPNYVNFFYLPYSVKNHDVFEAFDTNFYQVKAIVVRPDMHIGYINDIVDIGMIDNYLQQVAGVSVGLSLKS